MKYFFTVIGITLITGCAANSGVRPIGKDSYMVSRQAATGFSGTGNLKADAFEEAGEFCNKQGKQLQPISATESQPPYVLGNFPKAEVMFMCLSTSDAGYKRPPRDADQTIDVRQNNTTVIENDNYTKIQKLKGLLDGGAISPEEYAVEKKKLLN